MSTLHFPSLDWCMCACRLRLSALLVFVFFLKSSMVLFDAKSLNKGYMALDQVQRLVLLAVLQGLSNTSSLPGPSGAGSTSEATLSGAKALILISAALIAVWATTMKDITDKDIETDRDDAVPTHLVLLVLDGLQRVLTLFIVLDLTQDFSSDGELVALIVMVAVMGVINAVRFYAFLPNSVQQRQKRGWVWGVRVTRLFLSFGEKTVKVVIVIQTMHARGLMLERDEIVVDICLCLSLLLYVLAGAAHIGLDTTKTDIVADWVNFWRAARQAVFGAAPPAAVPVAAAALVPVAAREANGQANNVILKDAV